MRVPPSTASSSIRHSRAVGEQEGGDGPPDEGAGFVGDDDLVDAAPRPGARLVRARKRAPGAACGGAVEPLDRPALVAPFTDPGHVRHHRPDRVDRRRDGGLDPAGAGNRGRQGGGRAVRPGRGAGGEGGGPPARRRPPPIATGEAVDEHESRDRRHLVNHELAAFGVESVEQPVALEAELRRATWA